MNGIWGLIAAIFIPALLALLGFIFRHSLAEYITSGIKHSFDREIERLRADLARKENEISALREGALSGLSNRRAILAARRLQAVDQLWTTVVSLGKLKVAPMYVSILRLDNVNKRIASDHKLQEFFKMTSANFDLEKVNSTEAEKQRPFISLRSWALFSAYSIIILSAAARLKMLAVGVDVTDMFDEQKMSNVLKAALPHQSAYIDRSGLAGRNLLLDELEGAILSELTGLLDGKEDDEKAVSDARHILDVVEKARADLGSGESSKLGDI